jgi:hypothetical protein
MVDDDIYSTHSQKFDYSYPDIKTLSLIKGKLFMIFRADLTDEFVDRMESIKKVYIKDT